MKPIRMFLAALSFAALTAQAQPTDPGDPAVHDPLRALKGGLVEAMNKNDIDKILTYLHPNVVMTALNSEVSRGREGVKNYILDKTAKPGHFVKSFDCAVDVDELTQVYGSDTGIAFGSARQHYVFTTGMEITAITRWTATLVKEKNEWLIAAIHVSVNLFDNPLLNLARRSLRFAAAASFLIALVLGWFLSRYFHRRKA